MSKKESKEDHERHIEQDVQTIMEIWTHLAPTDSQRGDQLSFMKHCFTTMVITSALAAMATKACEISGVSAHTLRAMEAGVRLGNVALARLGTLTGNMAVDTREIAQVLSMLGAPPSATSEILSALGLDPTAHHEVAETDEWKKAGDVALDALKKAQAKQ